eukprot:jgi/Undpi1/1892/HiC_scaffold_12.g05279.m1
MADASRAPLEGGSHERQSSVAEGGSGLRDGAAAAAGGGASFGAATSSTLPLSALECGVCLSLVCQPVSLSCGHSFCRVCLVNTLRRNKKNAEDQPEDVMIANIARTCFPELYASRLREVEAEQDTFMAVLPIFYYNVPMFPGETLNLHLFEPRYKLMMQRVSECEFLSDGRVLLVAKLASRHTVVDHFVEDGTQGLHYCRLEPRHDDHPTDPDEAAKLESLHERTRALATRVVEPVTRQIVERYGEMPPSAVGLSYWAASVLPLTVREKQALLSARSTTDRLQVCERHLASLSSSNSSSSSDGDGGGGGGDDGGGGGAGGGGGGGGGGDGGGIGGPIVPPQRANAAAVAEAFVRHIEEGVDTEEALVAAAAAGPAGVGGGGSGAAGGGSASGGMEGAESRPDRWGGGGDSGGGSGSGGGGSAWGN